jgi:hypothetical protein
MSEPQTLFAINAVIVWLIQKVKLTKWFPSITTETQKLNKILSAVAATLASAAIVFSFANPEHGTYIITVTGLTLPHMVQFITTAVVNYMGQKLIFKLAYSEAKGK